jgi:hypothetical protein
MSKYLQVATEIQGQEHLLEALEKRGFHPIVHELAQPLEGYEGAKRSETAEIVIPRRQVGSASNDIGFKRQANGTFRPIISEYDSHRYNDRWLAELQADVGVARATRLARRQYGCASPQIHDIQTADGPKRVVKFIIPS